MLLRSVGVLLFTLGVANGFKNSSPFFLLSTQPLEGSLQSAQVVTGEKIFDAVVKEVADCKAKTYFVVSQPGLTTADLRDGNVLPKMKARTRSGSEEHAGRVEVSSVLGELDVKKLVDTIASRCGTVDETVNQSHGVQTKAYSGSSKQVVLAEYEALMTDKRARTKALMQLDEYLDVASRTWANDYVFILASAPVETLDNHAHMYEMDEPYPTAMHQDLKRGLELGRKQSGNDSSNNNMQDGLPLFEKYQFLSPGIFMGLAVSLLLLVILWVGVSAIANLEVSYMAFSKEMGPNAQNKGKQQ